jgi:hypothetical protein
MFARRSNCIFDVNSLSLVNILPDLFKTGRHVGKPAGLQPVSSRRSV